MSSLKMTFSLTSLILIFAMVFVPTVVMAATGGPTVSIMEYTGKNDATPSVDHVQTRDDFRLKVTFSHLVTGFAADGVTVQTAASATSLLTTVNAATTVLTADSAATGVPDTELTENKVFVIGLDLNDTDYSAGYLAVRIAEDGATGAEAAVNNIGNQSGTFGTDDLPKATDWTVSLALDASTLKAADDLGTAGKLKTTAEFTVKFTVSPGSGAQPPIDVDQLKIEDGDGKDLSLDFTIDPGSGPITFVGVEGTVTYTYNGTADTSVMLSVNPQYMGGNTITVPEPSSDPVTPVKPTVELSLIGTPDEVAKTFRVRLEFSEVVVLAADKVNIMKVDPADAMAMMVDADVAPVELTRLGSGMVWVADVDYEFEMLPLYVSVDKSVVSGMTGSDGMDLADGLMVGEAGPTPPAANAPDAPDAPTAAINATNDLMIDVSWMAPADGGSAITGYTVTKYDSDGMVVKTFPETGDPAITDTMLSVGPVPGEDRGMSFTFTVTAMNTNGAGPESDASAAVTIPEAAPVTTNNAPTFQTGASVADIIIWQGHAFDDSGVLPKARDNEGDEISYRITPELPPGFELLADDTEDRFIEVREANKGDTVVQAATEYELIAADDKGAESDPSVKFKITVLVPIVPSAPTSVTAMEEGDLGYPANIARAINSNKVVVGWVAPVDTTVTSHVPAIPFGSPITGYKVYQNHENLDEVEYPRTGDDAIEADATSHRTPVLNPPGPTGTYDFEVAAVNAVGDGAKSDPEAPALVANPPSQPRDLRASKVPTDPNSTTLDWLLPSVDGGSEILGYVIYQTLDGGPEVTVEIAPAITHRLTDLDAGRHVFRVAAVNYDGLGNRSEGTEFSVDIPPDPTAPVNVKPTFGNETIANITATVGTAISSVTLPAATDPDGDDGDITYSLLPNPAAIGLSFNSTTRFLSGTPRRGQSARAYTYTARDAKGGTASLNFTLTVNAVVVVPPTPTGDLAATFAAGTGKVVGTTTVTSGSIGANDFATIGSQDLPDLEEFFDLGGTIGLSNGDATDDKNSRTVVISEILWGLDFGAPVEEQTQWQFIELYNTTASSINLATWTLTFTEGRPVPASDIDQVSNRYRIGWELGDTHGQSGRVTGTTATDLASAITPTNIISMYRNINYNHVETQAAKATVDRAELVKGIPGGNGSGSWKASQRRSEYSRWIYDSKRDKHFVSTAILTASPVARTPFIINEVGNGSGDTNDWVEIRNVTDSEASLKNYHLSYVSGFDKDTSLVNFKDKDIKVPGKGVILLVNTDPKNTGIAAGRNAAVAETDQELTGATSRYYINSNLKLPDNGKFNLILRNAHDKLKASSHFMDVIGGLVVTDDTKGTSLWPLVATGGPHGDVVEANGRDLKSGYVYIRKNAGGGTQEHHLGRAGYTGIGYDRTTLKSNANGGTPGYDNGALKEKIADLSGAEVTISEIMFDTGEARQNLAQWIELYNASMTQAVNLNGWKLHLENAATNGALETNTFSATITLDAMTISPNQTVLIATTSGRVSDTDHFPSTRVVNLWTTKKHRDELEMARRTDPVLSSTGFHLKLTDKDNKLVDEAGNLDGNRRTRDEIAWTLPVGEDDGRRSSLIRVYDDGVAVTGTMEDAWTSADATNLAFAISHTFYGDADDFGTPGFRAGGPVPVSLSKFRPERLESGEIVVRWTTESELNNAGFNILRSETRNGQFTQINTSLIAGQGTTSERTAYEWKDTSAKPSVVYYYQIQDVSLDGKVQTLRQSRLKGNVSAAGKITTTWGELKALQ